MPSSNYQTFLYQLVIWLGTHIYKYTSLYTLVALHQALNPLLEQQRMLPETGEFRDLHQGGLDSMIHQKNRGHLHFVLHHVFMKLFICPGSLSRTGWHYLWPGFHVWNRTIVLLWFIHINPLTIIFDWGLKINFTLGASIDCINNTLRGYLKAIKTLLYFTRPFSYFDCLHLGIHLWGWFVPTSHH